MFNFESLAALTYFWFSRHLSFLFLAWEAGRAAVLVPNLLEALKKKKVHKDSLLRRCSRTTLKGRTKIKASKCSTEWTQRKKTPHTTCKWPRLFFLSTQTRRILLKHCTHFVFQALKSRSSACTERNQDLKKRDERMRLRDKCATTSSRTLLACANSLPSSRPTVSTHSASRADNALLRTGASDRFSFASEQKNHDKAQTEKDSIPVKCNSVYNKQTNKGQRASQFSQRKKSAWHGTIYRIHNLPLRGGDGGGLQQKQNGEMKQEK